MKAGKLEVGEAAEMKKGAWSSEEDAKLVEIVGMYGPGRWNSLAQAAGLQRTGKSCRLRWLNYLRPNVRHGGFTLDEQLLILQLYFRWGNRWAKIAEQLSGRTDNDIKNYWRTRILKHARHLNCDVNSPQFKQAIRDVWIPTLVDRITTGFGSESEARSWITQTHLPINSPQDASGHRPTLVEQIKPGSGSGSRSESESGSCVSPAHLHLNSPQDVSGPDPYHNIVIELPSIGPPTGPGTLKPVKECGVLGPLGDTKSPDELVNGPDFDSFAFESCPSPWSASKLDFDYDLQACDYGDAEDIFDKGIEYSYLMV